MDASLNVVDFLDFPFDEGEPKIPFPSSTPSCPESVEEELEWILNKDIFPGVETMDFGTFGGGSNNHLSPVSVLENTPISSTTSTTTTTTTAAATNNIISIFGNNQVPVRRARSKRCRLHRQTFPETQLWGSIEPNNAHNTKLETRTKNGRRCHHCLSEKTPQWRAGPMGPKTLCNACGVRFKSGRLVPEYRPANSPTFSSRLHSNSHRKVMEMRRQKNREMG